VKFHSNLLGGFGAGFVTPVNTINFATVFDDFAEKLIDNVAVWTTIVAFIIVYIPFAVLARYLDKKDAFKVLLFHYLMLMSQIYLRAKSCNRVTTAAP